MKQLAILLGFSFPQLALANMDNIIRCDDGKVVIDVDSNKRTNIQLVSRNTQANQYIYEKLRAHAAWANGGSSFFELGWSGHQPRGVYTPSDFEGATQTFDLRQRQYAVKLGNDWVQSYVEYVSFFWTSPNQIKFQVTRSNIFKCIRNSYDGRFGKCFIGVYQAPDEYVGDWYFNECYKR